MQGAEGILDTDAGAEDKPDSHKLDVYKAQRAHYTKLVETLYRVLPFYVGIVGTLWAYGLGIVHSEQGTRAQVIFASGLASFLFAHIVARYGANMDATLARICDFEGSMSVTRAHYPTDLPVKPVPGTPQVRDNLANATRNQVNWLRNIRSHDAISICFLSSGILAVFTGLVASWQTIVWAFVTLTVALAILGGIGMFMERSKGTRGGKAAPRPSSEENLDELESTAGSSRTAEHSSANSLS